MASRGANALYANGQPGRAKSRGTAGAEPALDEFEVSVRHRGGKQDSDLPPVEAADVGRSGHLLCDGPQERLHGPFVRPNVQDLDSQEIEGRVISAPGLDSPPEDVGHVELERMSGEGRNARRIVSSSQLAFESNVSGKWSRPCP